MKREYATAFIPYDQMEIILPLVDLLNEGRLAVEILKRRMYTMLEMWGYQCIGVYYGAELLGICGVWVLNKLYAGHHVEPDNVFVKIEHRSNGVGALMMEFLFKYAQQIGCEASAVNCYVNNLKGKRFWES